MNKRGARFVTIVWVLCLSMFFGWLFNVLSSRKPSPKITPVEKSSADQRPSAEPATRISGNAEPQLSPPSSQDVPRVGSFTADKFDDEWRAIMEADEKEDYKTAMLGQLVFRMSKLGHIKVATRKILGTFGPGDNRNRLLRVCFNSFGDGAELEAAYGLLEFDDEKKSARRGIASRVGREAFETKSGFVIDPAKYGFLKDDLPDLKEGAAISYVDWFVRNSPENAEKALDEVLTNALSPSARNSILSALAPFIPFAAWEKFQVGDEAGDLQVGVQIVERMVSRDPVSALQAISKTDVAGNYIPKAMLDWMRKDTRKPIEWVESNRNALPSPQLDAAISGIVSYGVFVGERETAYQWAQQIGDEENKKKLLEELDKRFAEAAAKP